jgi:hypothetical protein
MLVFKLSRSIGERLHPEFFTNDQVIQEASGHAAKFSWFALRQFAEQSLRSVS